jgi:hypothetical protein
MRGCGDPFWETVEQAYRGCSVLVGCKCSCRGHDGELAAIQRWCGNAVARAQVYSSDGEQQEKLRCVAVLVRLFRDVMTVSGVLGGRLQRWRGQDWTRR